MDDHEVGCFPWKLFFWYCLNAIIGEGKKKKMCLCLTCFTLIFIRILVTPDYELYFTCYFIFV